MIPQPLPDTITRDGLLTAMQQFDAGVEHRFAESTAYDLLFEGRRYPPKAIVGIAARLVTGHDFGPEDFSAGIGSKCFRIIQSAGFEIVAKSLDGMWLFQGNPERFDINDYLSRYAFVYWSVPRSRSAMRLGESCVIWRSGDAAGAVAVGRIAELPVRKASVRFPESLGDDLWRRDADSPSDFKVGIEIDEHRLDLEDGYVSRDTFRTTRALASSTIIRMPTGTVFRLSSDEAAAFVDLWRSGGGLLDELGYSAVEGSRRLRQHYSRERCRSLIERKRLDFAQRQSGRVFCELCKCDFSERYPATLGAGFIEVHHLTPLSADDEPRRTTLDDLMLVCANCHRMIHRTSDADANLCTLRRHFGVLSEQARP